MKGPCIYCGGTEESAAWFGYTKWHRDQDGDWWCEVCYNTAVKRART